VAHALAQRGIEVSVFERETGFASMASGNPAAVFRPVIARDEHPGLRLTRAAFLHDLATWSSLGTGVTLSNCGVLHLAKDAVSAARQKEVMERDSYPMQFARWVDIEEANVLADWPVGRPGVFYPRAGWVVPSTLCHAWLGNPRVEVRCDCAVDRITRNASGWQLRGTEGQVLADADAVVLANARDAADMAPNENWPIQTVRGQVTLLPPEKLRDIKRVIASEGYLSPTPADRIIVGATYDHDTHDVALWPRSDFQNMRRLGSILPGAGKGIALADLEGRASLRAVLPDRLPLLGPIRAEPGLYVAAGYASRGVVWAGLLGETLASLMLEDPLPLERDLIDALSPERFGRTIDRDIRR
jgi:tRNA 5-methylaminomethyl-2-thiouridine biosynthesis bifunctional protein